MTLLFHYDRADIFSTQERYYPIPLWENSVSSANYWAISRLPLSKDLFHQESPYSLSDSGEIKSEAGVFLPREVWDSIGELGKVL